MTDEAKKLLREALEQLRNYASDCPMTQEQFDEGRDVLAELITGIDAFLARPEPAAQEPPLPPTAYAVLPSVPLSTYESCLRGLRAREKEVEFLKAELAAAPQDQSAEIERLRAENDQLNARLHCMCGSPVDAHGMGDGHTAVSIYDYALEMTERAEAAESALREQQGKIRAQDKS